MTFHSILFEATEARAEAQNSEAPAFFKDLNLGPIVDAIVDGRQDYDLKPAFYTPLTRLSTIGYRHEVMRDLEDPALFRCIASFAERMRAVRLHLGAADKLSYAYEKKRWLLDSVEIYGGAIEELLRDLREHAPKSRGLSDFREYLGGHVASEGFQALRTGAQKVAEDLSAIRYCVLIKGGSVTVRTYDSEIDYSAVVEEAFAKFKQGAAKDYRVKFPPFSSMNHVEAEVLDRVARLKPDAFRALDAFCAAHRDYLDPTIRGFDREIQFYVAYLEYAATFLRVGLRFCYPRVSDASKEVASRNGYDLALAGKLIRENRPVVCNDFALSGTERILVVTGPNQGGKTTFSRVFGQLHYLASLGCPVPGSEARLFLFDRLFTHFEREEHVASLRGKLQDDLIRMRRILAEATPKSIVIVNEIFSSTSVKDAVALGRRIMEKLSTLDALGVCVTFLDELSSMNERTVSVVAGVDPADPTVRTHRIERRPADGLAYAVAIAEKHRLTYARLKERIAR
ncbi:MAG: MutS-related protein [Opitutaceae bacterium]